MRLAAVTTTKHCVRAQLMRTTSHLDGRIPTTKTHVIGFTTTQTHTSRGITITTHATTTHRDDDEQGQGGRKQMKMTETLRVKKLSETATLPVRGSDGAAGYDLARYENKDEDSLGFHPGATTTTTTTGAME